MSTRRRRRLKTNFSAYLDANFPGLIRWPLQEVSGDVAFARNFGVTGLTDSSQYPGPELLPSAGGDTMHVSNWTANNNANLTNPSSNVLRIARDGTNLPNARQTITTTGVRYWITGQARGDGTSAPNLQGGTYWQGTTSTDWQEINIEVVANSTIFAMWSDATTGTSYVEFRNMSVRTANPLNGDNDGATVGQPFGGNIQYSYSCDGNNDKITVNAAALDSAWNSAEGGLFAFVKIPSAAWTDGQIRVIADVFTDNNNFVQLAKWSTNNLLICRHIANGTTNQFNISTSETNPFLLGMTWNKSQNRVRMFIDGVQQGADSSPVGVYTGALTSATFGVNSTSILFHSGLIAEVLLPTTEWTPAEIAEIYARSGI